MSKCVHILCAHAEKAVNGVLGHVSVYVIFVWLGVLSIKLQGNLSP